LREMNLALRPLAADSPQLMVPPYRERRAQADSADELDPEKVSADCAERLIRLL
jgi:hypothetical protein